MGKSDYPILTVPLLAVAGVFVVVSRQHTGSEALKAVLALFALSIIGGIAFLLGRAHARYRRAKKNKE